MAQMMGLRSVIERLAHLADLHGVERDGSVVIEVPFTHAELAYLVGGTRQWIAMGLRRLSEIGHFRAKTRCSSFTTRRGCSPSATKPEQSLSASR